uniref:Si:ch73-233k15.2 n=1 Tax=Neogobius melanostomus TaxID=47308 RepID=A0A8C6WXN8_9GOBI
LSTGAYELEEALTSYAMDTFSYIETMKDFLDGLSKWMLMRKTELNVLLDIKERAASIELSVSHVTQSQDKGKAFLKYMKSKFVPSVVERQRKELQGELAATLKTSLMGLAALGRFLDAVERLCVTSVHVFQEDNPVLLLPEEGALDTVQHVIIAAQGICPHLVEFKRDNADFFSPKLQNVEVLAYQLDKYIKAVQMICGTIKKGPVSEFNFVKLMVDIDEEISEDDVQKMLHKIHLLQELRQDEAFRMVFLFQAEYCSSFMERFSESEPRMQQFLSELEDSAVQLDRMNMGARISSVAGSSVGAVSGVLSIIGLALIPVTAGASLALIMTGVGLGITSGVNSAVTTFTEIGVNRSQQKRASETFQKFMEDVKNIQDCLDNITSPSQNSDKANMAKVVTKVLGTVGKGIDFLVDAASAAKQLRSEAVLASAGKVVAEEGKALRNVPRVASELPDMGQAAARGPLALSRGARGGFIALNALFLGMDMFFIVKDSMNLARGSETKVSKIIRARSALWRSEMDSWQKIYELLEKGQVMKLICCVFVLCLHVWKIREINRA